MDYHQQHHHQVEQVAITNARSSIPMNFNDNSSLPTPPASSIPNDYDHQSLPKVGQTRCYWALLSDNLQFVYLDPVLACHLEEQADSLIGKSILQFVHPEEQQMAKQDIGGVLESRTLHGTVTRVRFSRLSRVRRQLGYTGPPLVWSEAEKISCDNEYMPVDIVINMAAERLVLAFIHATVDLTPNDNDESQKSDWTNWCGTPYMPTGQLTLLYHRLLDWVPPSGSPTRVFQILQNQRNRPLLMSWPPDPLPPTTHAPTSKDFARIVENVQMGNAGNDAKTSCTRRFQALQKLPPVFGGEVESIFIPHGSIIFACHKVNPAPRNTTVPSPTSMASLAYASAYNSQQAPSYYDQGAPYSLPPLSPQSQSYSSSFIQQQGPGVQPPYSPSRWNQPSLPSNGVSNIRSGSYTSPSSISQSSWPPTTSPYLDTTSAPSFNRSTSPTSYNYSPTTASSGGPSPTSDVVPPPRRRISPVSTRDQTGPIRAVGNRPMGVQKCSSCKATSSPEWRKGPSGKKELCNACGLRYARSRAKKEGPNQTQQRRKKEKALTIAAVKRESSTPPINTSVYPAMRRHYADGSFSTNSSAGSASGSDIYPPHSSHVLGNLTPSPSPPAPHTVNFVHYAPGGADNRQPPYSSTSNNFYSTPSPLSTQPVMHSQELQPQQQPQQHHQSHTMAPQHLNTTQLPPLGHISSYAGRLSPMMPSSTSTLSHSSLSSNGNALPPSYERERERDRDFRDLPPTPLSAEPRNASRRSILTQQ